MRLLSRVDSVLELDISSDGAIRPFKFEEEEVSEEELNISITQNQPQTEGKNPSIFVGSGSKIGVMFTKFKCYNCFKRIHVFLVCCRNTDAAFSPDFLRVSIFPDVIFSLSIPEKEILKMFE